MSIRRSRHAGRLLIASGMAAVVSAALIVVQPPGLVAQPRNPQYTVLDYGPMTNQNAVLSSLNNQREIAGGFRRPGSGKISGAVVGGQQSQQEIDTGPRGEPSVHYDINDRGDVVGSFAGDTAVRPFRSNRTAAFRELPLLPGDTGGIARAVNGAGEAVGYSSGADGQRAVSWDGSGAVTALPSAGAGNSRAAGVNDRGDTVGSAGDQPRQATLWPGRGSPVTLRPLAGYTGAEALTVEEGGAVV